MIQIDKLIRIRDVADDIEFTDGLVLRGPKRYSSGRVAFAVKRVFRPLPRRSQIFGRIVVFDENVHSGHLNKLLGDPLHVSKQILKGTLCRTFYFWFRIPLPLHFKAGRLQGLDGRLQSFHLLLCLFKDRAIILRCLYQGIEVSIGASVGHKKLSQSQFPFAQKNRICGFGISQTLCFFETNQRVLIVAIFEEVTPTAEPIF